jgi:hypothetical protein
VVMRQHTVIRFANIRRHRGVCAPLSGAVHLLALRGLCRDTFILHLSSREGSLLSSDTDVSK